MLIVLQGLEATLQDPKKKYQDKVNALLSAWERFASLTDFSPDAIDNLTDCIHRCAHLDILCLLSLYDLTCLII